MTVPTRYYGNGQAKTLVGGISNVATSLVVNNTTGLPTSFPYTIAIDRGTALEDVMDVTSAAGTTLTVTRNVDGYTGQAHSNGARVEHVTTARDYAEFQLAAKTIPHTWAIYGAVAVPSGDTDFILPFFVPVPSGQGVVVVGARHKINSGTSVTATVNKNGSAITGLSALSITTTATTSTATAGNVCADGDALALVVSAVSGSPKNMTFTLYLKYTG